ncbi:ArsR/SmtB family transcription factor [Cohaesibacter celericrescens]
MRDTRLSSIPLEMDLTEPQNACCSNVEDLALAYKALSHPVRLMILSKIGKQSSRCCGDICSALPLAQSTVSQHLKVLRECGFIELETAGQQSHYRINQEKIKWLSSANDLFFAQFGSHEPSD